MLFATAAIAAAAGLLFTAAPVGAGTVYKWVDANGRVVYSDQPPPGDVKREVVKPPPPPDNPNAAKDLDDQEFARKQGEKKRVEAAQAAEKTRVDAERRRESCAAAQGNLRLLQNAREPLYRMNDKGERVYYDDGTRRDEIARVQQIIRDTCMGG